MFRLQAKYKDSGRLELVTADVYDKESLIEAFKNAYGVFAQTNNRIPGKKIETEQDMDHELVAGRNIIDAAKHFVMSSLPNITNASKGRFTKVFHFDNKHKIEQWARDELPAVTALHPGPEKTASKTYPVVGPKLSFADFARVFREITSQEAIFDPITLDEWGATVAATAGKGYEEDIRQMMEWISVAPDDKICYGTMDRSEDRSYEDLGVKASTLADWMRRAAWQGPQ
ncbi:hypothetical protein APSETT445_005813 [Aspergillus pseudonomiae]